ncbi:DUF2058 domain-containing protein [Silanimonas sp.]|jgi:uncharacterized protein YaiL (DUF2058 family)|uniref:DUF2058 domain-containing protein n=1 Tax=Silanimonas sp. TaxID=1929290 RepID=UPI0037C961D5
MAKLNALQEQLLKAGLAKKSKAAEAAREQEKARRGEAPSLAAEIQRETERARAEKVERDRALAATQKAEAHAKALRAQARQIIVDKHVPHGGDIEYRFAVDGAIRSLLVDEATRRQLANGQVVIVRFEDGVALLPQLAAEKVRERAPDLIVLDNRSAADTAATAGSTEDDAYYAQFTVPDDLVW